MARGRTAPLCVTRRGRSLPRPSARVPGRHTLAAPRPLVGTGGDRFRIASDMFDTTRAMVIAGIRAEKPQITESELRQELFLRYDGDECSPEQRKKSLAAIADYWRRKEAAQDA